MHGGNYLTASIESIEHIEDVGYVLDLYVMNEGEGWHATENYRIQLDHIEKIEFLGKRAKTGFEFIGLD